MSFKGICILCFSDVNNQNAVLLTDATKEILDVLLINYLGGRSDHAICNVCSERVFAAFEFKSTCKYTDAIIIPYVDWEKPTQLDLWDVYLGERDSKQTVMNSEDEQVCRLCMELTGKMYVPLRDIDMDVFQNFLPEINVNILKDPVVCQACFDSLATHNSFFIKLKNCRGIDQKETIQTLVCSRKMDHADEPLQIKMEEVDIKLEIDSYMQLETIKMEIEECEIMSVKNEDVEAEVENNGTSVKSLVSEIHPVAMESKGQTIQTATSRVEIKNRFSCKNDDTVQKHFLETKLCKCDMCHHRTNNEKKRKSHHVIHKDSLSVQMHKCGFCGYETKFKRYLKRHQVIHKDPSEVQMYMCDSCNYKTKRRRDIKRHQLKHADPSQVQMYKCDTCDYETKLRSMLKSHQLKHKDPSQVQMHKCDICTYETIYKGKLNCHQLVHKDLSEVQMFSCDNCEYKTKFKADLKRHQLMHKDPSQVQMFSCDDCDYKSKFKGNVKKHRLTHRDPSQVQMYNCSTCDYETKFKSYLKCHLAKHKNPSQVQMQKCDCTYETREPPQVHM